MLRFSVSSRENTKTAPAFCKLFIHTSKYGLNHSKFVQFPLEAVFVVGALAKSPQGSSFAAGGGGADFTGGFDADDINEDDESRSPRRSTLDPVAAAVGIGRIEAAAAAELPITFLGGSEKGDESPVGASNCK